MSAENYTQVSLSRPGGGFVCWVESRFAKVGKRVRDEEGLIWKVTAVYETWPKAKLDAQRQETNRFSDVLERP